ncbi:unnamed protein product [Symbiodinium necroappetens]|uniref:EF-hand domain-containing protein n=1 Tax=Symbiodinium necroappetens TaxID=1628268 RepID=A0A812SP31_9DINO|nr:unnamed protein product [Symbiodinium necroappetens]
MLCWKRLVEECVSAKAVKSGNACSRPQGYPQRTHEERNWCQVCRISFFRLTKYTSASLTLKCLLTSRLYPLPAVIHGLPEDSSLHCRKWALPKLLEVADLGEDLCGPNPEALRAAFKTLGSQSSCTKDRLKQLATGHDGGLTEADIDELFALCGASSQRVSTDTLVDGLVDCICQPKAHVHKAVLGQSRLFLPG